MHITTVIKSPVTHSSNVRKIESLDSLDIIKAYSGFGSGNVERFFSDTAQVDIFECLDTSYRFYYPFDISGDEEFYAYLQNKVGYYAHWRWEHQITSSQIEPQQKILEIGCGTGEFLERVKQEKKAECVGLELNQQAINKSKCKELEMYNQTIEQHAANNGNKYDVVCSFQVLEHVTDVKSFLESSITCLKEKGLLIIGVPNNNPYLFQNDKFHTLNLPPHHMGLWNEKSLRNIDKFFDIKLKKIMIEPLFDTDYFWKIKMEFWRKNNRAAYFIANILPQSMSRVRNKFLQKICQGRNILAIYSKR